MRTLSARAPLAVVACFLLGFSNAEDYDEQAQLRLSLLSAFSAKPDLAEASETPLGRAVKASDNAEAIRLLEEVTAFHPAVIHLAAQSGSLDIIRRLVAKGADVNFHVDRGWSPLFYAVKSGHVDAVKFLISRGAKVDHRGSLNHSLLHIAAAYSSGHPRASTEIALLLVEAGADVNATAKSGFTPLHEAALSGAHSIAEVLLGSGARINPVIRGSGHCLDPDNDFAYMTPLDLANRSKGPQLVKMLRKHDAKTAAELGVRPGK